VCRYTAEASDRYLAWFALEAHADPVTITRLCGSLGMCARHTRRLMSQPGAPVRLTAVYRYILEAARERIADGASQPVACPGCEHDEAAASRALDTLLEGVAEPGVKAQLASGGGLCVPHVRAAASVRRQRRAAAWLAEQMCENLRVSQPSLAALAGGPDHDAGARARLQALLPRPGHAPLGAVCWVCAAVAHTERDQIVTAAESSCGICLCPVHLHDAVLTAQRDPAALLARQAEQQAAQLASPPRGKLLPAGRTVPHAGGCGVCAAREAVGERELAQVARAAAGHGAATLCVRHVLALRPVRSPARQLAAALAAQRAGALIAELAEAFRNRTWDHRHQPTGTEMTAWRRAAAFLDGGVCGGVVLQVWLGYSAGGVSPGNGHLSPLQHGASGNEDVARVDEP
jgi:hypothetical protein